MRRLVGLAALALAVTARAVWVEVPDFSPGLNTVTTARQMQPGEARVCHNWDLNDAPGGLVVRPGYQYVLTLPGVDSMLWNQPMVIQYSDGSKEMLLAADSAGVGYANIYRSERNSLAFGTLDTFRLVPLVQVVRDSAAAFEVDTATWSVTVTVNGQTSCPLSVVLDTGTAAADVVDTLISLFEATTCTTWFKATRDGDTLVLAERGNDILSQITPGAKVYRPSRAYMSFNYQTGKDMVRQFGHNDSLRYWMYFWFIPWGWGMDMWSLTVDTADYTREEIVDSLARIGQWWWDYWGYDGFYDTADHGDSTLIMESAEIGNTWTGWINVTLRQTYYNTTGPPGSDEWKSVGSYATWYTGDAEWHQVAAWDSTSASYIAPERVATYFPATGVPQYAVYGDRTYIVNGVGRGIVYDGRNGQPFPTQAAGEVLAVPLTGSGGLSGRYRYCLRAVGDSVATSDTLIANRWGYLSQPIIVDGGAVLLYGFPRRTYDWRYGGEDSITYEIWRTVGSVGQLDKADSIWNTGLTVHVDSSNYAAVTVTDTLSDATLRTKTGRVFVDGTLYGWKGSTTDTGTYTLYRRPGAVGLKSVAASGGDNIWTTGDTVIPWEACAGFSVMVVPIDTTLDIPADSGVSWTFYQWSEATSGLSDTNAFGDNVGFKRDSTEVLEYILPRPAGSNIMYLVYRGPVQPTAAKTAKHIWLSGTWPNWTIVRTDVIAYAVEFFTPRYYLVGMYRPGDTVEDRISYDSLLVSEQYERNAIPAVANAVGTFDNRMFLADGSYVQYSTDPNIDTTGMFLTFNRIGVNTDDGDQITAMWGQTGVMRVGKNRSTYSLYKNSAGQYQSIELGDHYGVLAGLSHASAPEGDWFLSEDGVRLEDEGIYKERSFIGSLMSGHIKSFAVQPVGVLQRAVAAYHDNAYLVSIPELDTTWVCFKIARPDGSYRYSWGTWGFTFSGAAHYSVSKEHVLTPADSLYFTMAGGSSLYRFGASVTDDGTPVAAVWESGPVGPMDGELWDPVKAGLWVESGDTVSGALELQFYDDVWDTAGNRWGTVDTGKTVTLPGLRERRYHLVEIGPGVRANDVLYWTTALRAEGLETIGAETVIEGMKIELVNRGPAQRR